MHRNQFELLLKKRFLPLFLTQFLGAFNDNVFKNSLVILIAFQLSTQTLSSSTLINLAAAFFIVPFFLFSALFGQISDKFEKSRVVQASKILEFFIMLLASAAFYTDNVWLLLSVLFLLGTQSSLFGPAKYSILPQHLHEMELIGGNALIESSTFLAIIVGSLVGGVLITLAPHGKIYISITIIVIAILGFIASLYIPKAPATAEHLPIKWNIFTATWDNIKLTKKNRTIFQSILGISWFWFFGSLFFYQIGNYVKEILSGGPHIVTLLILTFAIGIAVGALLCEKISRQAIELALVPLGAIGLSVFSFLLYVVEPTAIPIQAHMLAFLNDRHGIMILLCIFFIAVSGGLYSVPLYALVQELSPAAARSRIIAANNILNALFMVLAAVFAIVLLSIGLTIPHLFLASAILNAGITAFIFFEVPEFIMRFLICSLGFVSYRVKTKGTERLPRRKGPMIYACNHISFVDPVIVAGVSRLPARFMMDFRLFNAPILKWISRMAKVIPVATKHEDEKIKNQAFYRAAEALQDNQVVCIFPEGSISRDGKIGEFKYGIEKLVNQTHVPVLPMAVQGLWGSFFSRKYGKAMSHLPKRWGKSTIGLNIGKPIPYEEFSLERLKREIQALHDDPVHPDIIYED